MWVVDSSPGSTPSNSTPSTPLPHITTHSNPQSGSSLSPPPPIPHNPSPISLSHPAAPHQPHAASSTPQAFPPLAHLSTSSPSVSASALPGAHVSGRLNGVVSLTDILNLFARASGMQPSDPEQARRFRRGSSASTRSSYSGRGPVVG